MANLSELSLRTSYHKGRDDIAEDFYLPCMRRSSSYDRAVGYFRSTVFLIAWPALRDFVSRGGKIQVLCSQVLSRADIDALATGYAARVDEKLAAHFTEEVRSALVDPVLRAPARVLAALVSRGTIDLQIAVLRDTDVNSAGGRIFHDKLGIFRDEHGNFVVFKGSMNETWTGLAADGNLESVDVAASWMGARDLERARTEDVYFADLWGNRYPSLTVRPFPKVARDELERAADNDWESSVETMLEAKRASRQQATDPRNRTLLPHQAAGLASWKANNRCGILAFATGSGKTFTAINAIRDAVDQNEIAVVVVPDRVLFAQWHKELEETTRDLGARILRAGSGYNDWRSSVRLWTTPGDGLPRIVLTTLPTAASDDFLSSIFPGKHLVLIADEVHRLGSPQRRALLDERLFGPRLGLSATPERAGDPLGTASLLTFFRGILEPRYTLADAVRDGVLAPYFYRPHNVQLSDAELAQWTEVSKEIAQLHGRLGSGDGTPGLQARIQRLVFQRAGIVKHAAAKVPLAVQVLTDEYKRGQRWIVYCENLSQLDAVSAALLAAGIQNMPYHSQMTGDRGGTLKWLERRGGVVVAIKCLDEGVDVPSVTHALILASSKNPREFVQRRGRVLRRAKHKSLAYVHDAIVVPLRDGSDASRDPIIEGELARAVEFAEHADNPASAADLRRMAVEAGIDWRTLLTTGTEDEDEGPEEPA